MSPRLFTGAPGSQYLVQRNPAIAGEEDLCAVVLTGSDIVLDERGDLRKPLR